MKRISKAVRRELLLISRRAKRAGAGFVLPTVTMVMLVVVLLTLSIAFRSFERVNQARNVRVNQALLSASTPALDRARAKIEKLLSDQTKTPADARLADDLTEVRSGAYLYKLPDEDVVKISFDIDNNGTIQASGADGDINSVGDNESSATAWRFPIDTDNDGKFDTYNLYGIFFRNPVPNDLNVMRERKPLDARTPPFGSTTSTNAACQALANSVLVGGSGWYLSDTKLKKSFFAYTVNVPIAKEDITGKLDETKYEALTGKSKAVEPV
ncbi:MAG: hormogonium polysaccharide biosynthesis protein HpsA, partial [Microcoleaceae cyanobacterium]